jgi:hypothetical protein
MSLKKLISSVATAAMLMGTMLSTPAVAQGSTGFSALQGVEAQALSVDELQAITGELNAAQIAAELAARANSTTNAALKAYLTKLAEYTLANATRIDAALKRLGLYTAP